MPDASKDDAKTISTTAVEAELAFMSTVVLANVTVATTIIPVT